MKHAFLTSFVCLSTLFFACLGHTDEVRDNLFSDVEDSLRDANAKQANILAPKSYSKAASAYESASKRYERGQSVERIQRDLQESISYLQKAIDATEIAKVTLASAIIARDDAIKASAEKFSPDSWKKAEQSFARAANRLETGSLKSAKKEAEEAEDQFREAELVAIKASYLNETRALIEKARENKAERYAPDTLSKAEQLLAQAETALSENRYDTDQPRAIAREAKYEARHANHIALTVEPVARKKKSIEQLILEMEIPFIKVAGELDMVPQLDGSIEDVSAPIREKITQLQKDALELANKKQALAKLETEMQELEIRVGMQSQRLEKQEKRRQQFEAIDRMFEANEAVVMKQGDDILLRMIGLNFKSGKSTIEADNAVILKKIQRALNVFPQAPVVIEGHTDSFGGDDANFDLSQERALSVRSYLLENMSERNVSSIKAEGYGEGQPIANNETPEGRTKNRRIDIKIKL